MTGDPAVPEGVRGLLSAAAVKAPVVASGGAGKLLDFYKAVTRGGASILLAASVFHYRLLGRQQVKQYLRDRGIEVSL